MTDFRNELQAIGFEVAWRPYRGDWYHAKRGTEHFSVHLLTGRLLGPWGSGNEYTWQAAIVEFGGVERPDNAPPPVCFLSECVAAGFELEPDRGSIGGNRWARHGGERYLLSPRHRTITGIGFREFTLDDFQSASEPLPEPPPRPFVSMREKPVVCSGRRHQTALFG